MPSSLFQHRQSPTISPNSQIGNFVAMAKANGNPMAFLLSVACQNPQVKNALDSNGGNYQAAVTQLANERGLDVNSLLNQASGLYNSFLTK